MNNEQYKRLSFRLSSDTFDDLQKEAELQYLSVSAYIRKVLDKELYNKENSNDVQRDA